MTAAVDIATGKLDLGRVLRDTMAVTGKRPGFVLGLSFLLSGLPQIIAGLVAGDRMDQASYFVSGWGALHILFVVFVSSFLTAALLRLALSELEGGTPSANEVFRVAGQLFLPLFAVNLLMILGIVGGLILLVVPGVMLALRWCVAGAALIDERAGITQSLGRSAQLTRDNRWRLLALFLLFFLVMAVANAVLGAFGLAASMGSQHFFSGPHLLGEALLSTMSTALFTPGVAAIYLQLKELKG